MTDRELLELAALAVGYVNLPIEGWAIDSVKGMRLVNTDHEFVRYWNPLTDDGDAFRLAMKLDMNLFSTNGIAYAMESETDGSDEQQVHHRNDPCAAMRLAVVRVAAEIGKEMKGAK